MKAIVIVLGITGLIVISILNIITRKEEEPTAIDIINFVIILSVLLTLVSNKRVDVLIVSSVFVILNIIFIPILNKTAKTIQRLGNVIFFAYTAFLITTDPAINPVIILFVAAVVIVSGLILLSDLC